MRYSLHIRTLLTLGLIITASHASSAEPPNGFTNNIGMKFKLIPAGEFMMGSSELRIPQHKVRLTKSVYLGVTEVTQQQYEKVMGENPSGFSKTGNGADKVRGMDTSNFPVERVSWEDAVAFCKKLSAKEGRKYRLPTEAEWEYACRAGSTRRYCFGDDEAALTEFSWYGNNSDDRPHPVAKKKSNAWGLYDVHGNVWEWCSDGYDDYAKSMQVDPTGPAVASFRVVRGGSWSDPTWGCQSSYRYGFAQSFRYCSLGFRVVHVRSGK